MREFSNELKQYVTPANTVIIIACIVVYIIESVICYNTGEEVITEFGALGWKQVIEDREYYRVLTYMFIHGSITHIFNNMLVLLFVGSAVEKIMGSVKYLVNYVASGFVAALVSIYYNMWRYNHTVAIEKTLVISVGASGAIFGTVGALLWMILANRGRIAGISVGRMIMFIIFSFYAGLTATGIDNAAHIGGLLFGFVSAMILYRRRSVYEG
ncbi:MAG: rhomboid family intramembrane serine protease [Lachnospiraceae bacterium]|nr:rhomboid family intramembrane serine protease [Lachnospiraceae bacterium]